MLPRFVVGRYRVGDTSARDGSRDRARRTVGPPSAAPAMRHARSSRAAPSKPSERGVASRDRRPLADGLYVLRPRIRRVARGPARAPRGYDGAARPGAGHQPRWSGTAPPTRAPARGERPLTVIAITGARVLPIDGEPFEDGVVVLDGGKIRALGPDAQVPDGAELVDARGKVITPGLIDAHAHVGLAEEAEGWAGRDVNEMTDPGHSPRPGARRGQPGRSRLRRRDWRRGPGRQRQPGLWQPDRRPERRAQELGADRRADVAAPAERTEVGARREPEARLRREGQDAVHAPGDGRGHSRGVRQGPELPGQAGPPPAGRAARAGHSARSARARPAPRDPWRQHCHRADDIATALRLADEFGYSSSSTTVPKRSSWPTSSPSAASRWSLAHCSRRAPRWSCATARWPAQARWRPPA